MRQSGRQTNVEEEFASEGDGTFLETQFTCVHQLTPWRPKRPETQQTDGDHIATVVGPEGEEIYCDEYGRVKIFFNWDRRDKQDDTASCWVRVSQNWAGRKYGGIMIPRIGQSVIVSYINGDIEQPVISGRLYNSLEQVPYKLPDNKTRSSWKSDTHKGYGFNEISMEDDNGREEIYVHAQKDRNEKVNNNHTERIDNNWVQSVGHSKAIEVTNNHDEVIGGNMTLTVGPSGIGSIVNAALTKLVAGIGNVAQGLGLPGLLNPGVGNMSVVVEKNKMETIGVASVNQIGVSLYTTVGTSYELLSGSAISFTAGEKSTENVGKTKLIQAGEEVSLSSGASRFTMKSNGEIHITGAKIFINGSELITAKSSKIKLN